MNIPATLEKCRAELARQQEMEQAERSKHPWKYSEWKAKRQKFSRWGIGNEDGSGQILSGFVQYWHKPDTFKLIVLSRNLNPARLKVAERWIEAVERSVKMAPVEARLIIEGDREEYWLRDAAALLGVEVVE